MEITSLEMKLNGNQLITGMCYNNRQVNGSFLAFQFYSQVFLLGYNRDEPFAQALC